MIYVRRVRRLVEIVQNQTENPTHPFANDYDLPDLRYCLSKFQNCSKRYTPEIAQKTLTIATGKGYLGITNHRNRTSQALQVRWRGSILMTRTGYINALGESVGKISPVISLLVAIFALGISVYTATHQQSLPDFREHALRSKFFR